MILFVLPVESVVLCIFNRCSVQNLSQECLVTGHPSRGTGGVACMGVGGGFQREPVLHDLGGVVGEPFPKGHTVQLNLAELLVLEVPSLP